MRTAFFFLVFAGTYFQAQSVYDKEAFKKCRKEFSKKICLSDEDHDKTPFYLDVCPKKFGLTQNNGCPVQAAVLIQDTTQTAELGEIFITGKPRWKGGCGQIINGELLKSTTK